MASVCQPDEGSRPVLRVALSSLRNLDPSGASGLARSLGRDRGRPPMNIRLPTARNATSDARCERALWRGAWKGTGTSTDRRASAQGGSTCVPQRALHDDTPTRRRSYEGFRERKRQDFRRRAFARDGHLVMTELCLRKQSASLERRGHCESFSQTSSSYEYLRQAFPRRAERVRRACGVLAHGLCGDGGASVSAVGPVGWYLDFSCGPFLSRPA